MTLKDHATRVAVLAALHEAIGDELKAARAEALAGLKAEKAKTGTQQIAASLPDETPVAKITLVTPGPSAVVSDDQALLAWVRDTHPTEIARRFVTEVRPAFLAGLLKEIAAAGVAQWCDKETGEVHAVPGVSMQGRAVHQRLTFEKGGRALVAAAYRSGRLGHLVLPGLTAGDDPGPGTDDEPVVWPEARQPGSGIGGAS